MVRSNKILGTGKKRQKKKKFRWQNLVKLISIVVLLCLAIFLYREAPGIIFPIKYGDAIVKYAKEDQIDPLLVCAIIKCESNFDADVKSKAGAVGLMQLMPDTAAWLAESMGIEYEEEHLTEADYNIALGCKHLDFLLDYWDNDLVKALASYNAGHAKVEEWLSAGAWDGSSETIEDIPYPETRKYVEKVLRNYAHYQELYGDDVRFQLS